MIDPISETTDLPSQIAALQLRLEQSESDLEQSESKNTQLTSEVQVLKERVASLTQENERLKQQLHGPPPKKTGLAALGIGTVKLVPPGGRGH
jgi:chromosome segregation ATPase